MVTAIGNIEKILDGRVGKAIARYDLIGAADRIMVALSGGKESCTHQLTQLWNTKMPP